MNNYFTYSVLQYKHSLTLGESLNVGILFYFSNDSKFQFVKGDASRIRAVYKEFDNALFNSYLNVITSKVTKHVDIFNKQLDKSDFSKYIHSYILAEDAAGLIFKEPVNVKNVFIDNDKIIEEYSQLL